jgi:glycosyltransferase involved in cell wall biosynthesis
MLEEFGILNTLKSCKNYVDRFVLVDTGSTDKTVEIIQRFYNTLKPSVVRELHFIPFVDFSTTRNEVGTAYVSLSHAYLFIISIAF